MEWKAQAAGAPIPSPTNKQQNIFEAISTEAFKYHTELLNRYAAKPLELVLVI